MTEKLTWEEIKKKYPNEWVTIVEHESDDLGYVTSGKVIFHHPKKKEYSPRFAEIVKNSNYMEFASLFTGEPKPRETFRGIIIEDTP